MHKWGTIQIAYIREGEQPDALLKAHSPMYEKFKSYRSEILEASLFIESTLDMLLCNIYVGSDQDRLQLFHSYILDPEAGTFIQKWKMLRGALHSLGVPKGWLAEDERKSLLTNLKQVISIRNRFAHGNLYIDARDGRPFLQYYEESKQEMYLDDNTIESIIGNANAVHSLLARLIATTN